LLVQRTRVSTRKRFGEGAPFHVSRQSSVFSRQSTAKSRLQPDDRRLKTDDSSHSWHLHAGQSPRETWFAHLLEHLFHLGVLAEQIIYFLHGRTGASGNAFAAAAINHFVVFTLVRRHGVDYGFDAVDLLIIDLIGGGL